MKPLKLILSAALCFSIILATQAQDERQRGGSRKFEPKLTGTWQLCTLTPGQDQSPQLSLLPVLKVIGADNRFQHIGIPSEGACFIQKEGDIEKTSDSTFVEHVFTMKPDSVDKTNTIYRFRLEGPSWLMIEYTEQGQEPVSELWMRLQPQRQGDRGPQHNGERPREPRQGDRGNRPNNKIKSNSGNSDNYNPFGKEDASDDDFE